MSDDAITVSVGEEDLVFHAGHDDFNDYLNAQLPQDKVGPAWNFLIRTVAPDSKEALKRLALSDSGRPKGMLVLQIASEITSALGGNIEVRIKKPTAERKGSIKMVGNNS